MSMWLITTKIRACCHKLLTILTSKLTRQPTVNIQSPTYSIDYKCDIQRQTLCKQVMATTPFLYIPCVSKEVHSGWTREVVRSHTENWMFFGRQFLGGRLPKFLTQFYKSGLPWIMCQSLVLISQVTSEIIRKKEKIINTYRKTQ